MIRCPECNTSFEPPRSDRSRLVGEWLALLLTIAIAWVILLGLYWLTLRVVG